MTNKTKSITKKLNKIIGKISNSHITKSLVGGLVLVMFPITMVGSIASLLDSVPLEAYQNFLETYKISVVLSAIYTITTNFIAIFAAFGISYTYAKFRKEDGGVVGMISIVSLLILIPLTEKVDEYERISYSLSFQWLGSAGLFAGIIIAFLSAALYCSIKKRGWTIRMPDSVPPIISDGFKAIIPGAVTLFIFAIIKALFTITPFEAFHNLVYFIMQAPLNAMGSTLIATLAVCFFVQLLWMFGVHGAMTIIPLVAVVWGISDNENLIAFNTGQEMTNIIGTQFFNFAFFAGTGFGLAICMVLFSKSKKYKQLGRMGIVPAAFGITEPLLYGTPIVLNFKLAIPFFLSPMISLAITYFTILSGLVPKMAGIVTPSGTPIIIRGILQGSWKFGVLQAVLVIVWVMIWYPFFKKIDKEALELEKIEEEKQSENNVNAEEEKIAVE